jgi:hypothetical protein
MEGFEAQEKETRMVDYIRNDWLRYNLRLMGSDPVNAHKVTLKGGWVRNHTQGSFGQRHPQQTTTDRLTKRSVQHGTQ